MSQLTSNEKPFRFALRHLETAPLATGFVGAGAALTVPQLAQMIGVHPRTIRRAIASGALPAAHASKKSPYRISRLDANQWWRSRGGSALFAAETPPPVSTAAPERATRLAAIQSFRGRLAHLPGSLDEFLAEKHAEITRENNARHPQQ